MSSRKETKLLFEGWRTFLTEKKKKVFEEEVALSEVSEADQKVISVFDFDGTLTVPSNLDVEACFQYVAQNAPMEGGKFNVSTDPAKASMRSEAQIKTADISYYAMFFSITRALRPLATGHFAQVKESPDTYILTKLRVPETVVVNKNNWIYKWFEEQFGEKADDEARTIGDKKRKFIASKLKFPRDRVILAKNKQEGITAILSKYNAESVVKLDLFDNSPEEMADAAAPAKKILGADKVHQHLIS
jgi:hypothetical protein